MSVIDSVYNVVIATYNLSNVMHDQATSPANITTSKAFKTKSVVALIPFNSFKDIALTF